MSETQFVKTIVLIPLSDNCSIMQIIKLCIIVTDVHEATYASENAKKKIFADDEMILLFRNDCHMCGGFPTAGMSQSCGKQWHLIIFEDEGDNHFSQISLHYAAIPL